MSPRSCHLTVHLDRGAPLHFQADPRAAAAFAAAVHAQNIARVEIDDEVPAWLKPLPCHQLWQAADECDPEPYNPPADANSATD